MGFALVLCMSETQSTKGAKMQKYIIKWKDGSTWEIWASNAHNAEQIAIGTAAKSSGKPCSYWAEQIETVTSTN